ncbi:MAG: hypothetical protein ABI411_08605 [Tahibacter sp.]
MAASAPLIAAMPLQESFALHSSGTWLVWGGEINLIFNPDALRDLGISVSKVHGDTSRIAGVPGVRYESIFFPARESGVLEVRHLGNKISSIGGGGLDAAGGVALDYPGGSVDLSGFRIRAAAGTLFDLEVTDSQGVVWFTADHAHYGFHDESRKSFGMNNMNLRLSSHFLEVLGKSADLDQGIGALGFNAKSAADNAAPEPEAACTAPWPTAGLTTDIQMVYRDAANNWTVRDDTIKYLRCSLPPLPSGGACTASSTTGKVVLAPDSSLINIGQTAVAWYEKFSGNFAPYSNDQHPFLIWNLYRVDANGRIKQIAASATKHAFLTINYKCDCSDQHIIYPTCEDTYAYQNNDNTTTGGSPKGTLAPRSEIIPSQAKWGRCGSIYDSNCDGSIDAGSGPANLYQYRMQVAESDLMAPLATGSKYYFEYWYIVRDDQVFYNTMGHREIAPQKNGSGVWSVSLVNNVSPDFDFTQGPVINRWINPVTPGTNAANVELSTPLGRARIASKVTDLGGGQWRYEYSVMNFDYAHVDIDPAHPSEPNLKLTANVGFDRFSVPVSGSVSNLRFDDVDNDLANDWTASAAGGQVTWTSASGSALSWGMMNHFEFTSTIAPVTGTIGLRGGATPLQGAIDYSQSALVPFSDQIFKAGFE